MTSDSQGFLIMHRCWQNYEISLGSKIIYISKISFALGSKVSMANI